MSMNKTRVTICGSEYVIAGEESETYIREIAREVERRIEELMGGSSCISLTMAAVLTAMNCCDEESKAVMSADNLRAQMKEYLADSARCRSEAEESRKEIERLQAELRKTQRELQQLQRDGGEQTKLDLQDVRKGVPPLADRPQPKEISAGEFMSLFDSLSKEQEPPHDS